uniref:Uncharacterized protein n=1 Tax=Pristionchus pacificus TaxID=54126 RepID=A0A2A6CCN5_PRIPA|eukprot:PDM75771.1 hypothetical protein PRIPAC_40150 [Pristionchus pacificus]
MKAATLRAATMSAIRLLISGSGSDFRSSFRSSFWSQDPVPGYDTMKRSYFPALTPVPVPRHRNLTGTVRIHSHGERVHGQPELLHLARGDRTGMMNVQSSGQQQSNRRIAHQSLRRRCDQRLPQAVEVGRRRAQPVIEPSRLNDGYGFVEPGIPPRAGTRSYQSRSRELAYLVVARESAVLLEEVAGREGRERVRPAHVLDALHLVAARAGN